MTRGECLRLLVGAGKNHLWVVLSSEQGGQVACVNITSLGSALDDETCILAATDHEFFTHRSCVVYEKATLIPVKLIDSWLRDGRAKKLGPMRDDVMQRIIQGAFESENTGGDVLAHLEHDRRG